MGYWLSLTSATRAAFLGVILPGVFTVRLCLCPFSSHATVIIKLFYWRRKLLLRSQEPTETDPLISSSNTSRSGEEKHSPDFDLGLARVSIAIEVVAYIVMAMT